ncbi:hypothetical protein TNCV_448451 [Trichonephila clavipes]|nr:hypothetical protein TNCV_448451 [Trichonephila clavipes]
MIYRFDRQQSVSKLGLPTSKNQPKPVVYRWQFEKKNTHTKLCARNLNDRWWHHQSPPPQVRHGTGGEGNILQSPALAVSAATAHKTFVPTNLTSMYSVRVVMVVNLWPGLSCHGFDHVAYHVERMMHVKSVETQNPFDGLVWKFGRSVISGVVQNGTDRRQKL